MIYEHRTYHCVPGRLPDLLKRFEHVTLRLFRKHEIEPIGYWTVAVGASSQDFLYIIKWKSMADREEKWHRFQSDPEWAAAREETERDGPLVASLTNAFLKPAAFFRGA